MTQDGRQFPLVVQFGQKAAVDCNLAAGQRPGVRCRVVEDNELVRQIAIADRRHALPHVADVTTERFIDLVPTPLALLRREVLFSPDGKLLALGDQCEFAFSGDGIDCTTAEKEKTQRNRQGGFHETPEFV